MIYFGHRLLKTSFSVVNIYACRNYSLQRPTKTEWPTVYDSTYVEKDWYAFWNENEFFNNNSSHGNKKFYTCLPPPNITGNLHIGHALTVAIEDTIARW